MEAMHEVCPIFFQLFILQSSSSSHLPLQPITNYQQRALRAPKHPLAASDGARNLRPSQAGTKRLFSDRVSRLIDSSDNYDENNVPKIAADEIHDEKRSRGSDWPLRKASPLITDENVKKDSSSTHRSLSPGRGSRFVEGSMNDRASKVPPAEFIGDEHLREAYSRSRARSRAAQQSSTSVPASEKADTTRHSGIFRFGKSVAATFNPANWRIWKQPVNEETAQQKALRERQEKAERIYRELKELGKFRDAAHPPTFHVAEYDGKAVKREAKMGKHESISTKHDSGIDFDNSTRSGVTPIEEKRRGRVFLEPPTLTSDDGSPYADPPTTAPRSSMQIHRPSSIAHLQPPNPNPSPRKLRSSSRRRSLSIPRLRKASSTISPRASKAEDRTHTPPLNLRRVSSRSDLKKHKRNTRRLVKRVSDLEGKLAAARKELYVVAGEAVVPPGSQSQSQIRPADSKVQTRSMRARTNPNPNPSPYINSRNSSSSSNVYIPSKPQQQEQQQATTDAEDENEDDEDEDEDEEEEDIKPPIRRPRFVPGALATLPSERLLSGYVPPSDAETDEDADATANEDVDVDADADVDVEKIGRAVSTDYGERREGFEWPDYVF